MVSSVASWIFWPVHVRFTATFKSHFLDLQILVKFQIYSTTHSIARIKYAIRLVKFNLKPFDNIWCHCYTYIAGYIINGDFHKQFAEESLWKSEYSETYTTLLAKVSGIIDTEQRSVYFELLLPRSRMQINSPFQFCYGPLFYLSKQAIAFQLPVSGHIRSYAIFKQQTQTQSTTGSIYDAADQSRKPLWWSWSVFATQLCFWFVYQKE